MAQRESEQEDHFNLLPFIAILLCVLGTELLVTMSMATVSLGAGAGEEWVPAHNKDHPTKNPVLIEWDGKVAVVQKEGSYDRIPVTFHGDDTPPELKGILAELAASRETDYALFAVRPSGFENYSRLAAEFKEVNIDVGFEPVEQWKRIKLSRKAVAR